MTIRVVVGAQFGDEAKGKISDFLSAESRYVVRTGGGPNAGHSIHLPQGAVVLHQLSCGVLRTGAVGVSGPGMVLQPTSLDAELAELARRDLLKGEVAISDRAHVLLPVHEIEDAWEDELRARGRPGGALGTTKTGIGPAYADRASRFGLRMADLLRPSALRERLELLYARKTHLSGLPPIDELAVQLAEVGGRLAPRIRPTEPMLWQALERGESVLLEGAQSALLDLDFGTYPFVTSSHPTSAGALVGSGLPPTEVEAIIGVSKAYTTRVGTGPFPTEDTGPDGEFLRRVGGERGATTGRPRRCGWLDLVHLRYGARLNGFTSLAITKIDVLGGRDEVPVCAQYLLPDGTTARDLLPTNAEELDRVQPVYERYEGWPEFNERLKARIARDGPSALPASLRRFLDRIAQEVGVPVEFVSYGAQRADTVRLGSPNPRRSVARWTG